MLHSLQNASREAEKSQFRKEGFIDEAVVQKMVIRNAYDCQRVNREEMAMSSNNDDYAGWNLPSSHSPGRAA